MDDERWRRWIQGAWERMHLPKKGEVSREEFFAETGEEPYEMRTMRGDEDFVESGDGGADGLSGVREHGNSGRTHAAGGETEFAEWTEHASNV